MVDIDQNGSFELLGLGFQEGIFYYIFIDGVWERCIVYSSLLVNSWGFKFYDVDVDGLMDIVFGLDILINLLFF